jgi:Na+-transporting NADH:ubiquinone oxidoreductase subunit NqrB
MRFRPRLPGDPRYFQIAFLSSFLAAGLTVLHFDVPLWQPPAILAAACATQFAMMRLFGVKEAGYLSPIITSLGLSLLLRTDLPWVPPFAASVAVAGKFLIRVRGKHLFNPTTLGLAVSMLVTSHAWCSPAQWGDRTILLAWFVVFGCAVVYRAFRTDVSLAFLGGWLLLKAGRVLYLGQRPEVLWHQLSSGSLILFAFFMISDPKTIPDHRAGRILHAAAVAALAFYLQHHLWRQNALIWSLFFLSPLVPLIDRLLVARRYLWEAPKGEPCPPLALQPPSPSR